MNRKALARTAALGILFVPLWADVSLDPPHPVFVAAHLEVEGRLITRIYALDVGARKIRWFADTPDAFEVRAYRTGNTLVVPHGKSGRIMGLDVATGRRLWVHIVGPFRCMRPLDARTILVCHRDTHVTCLRVSEDGRARKVWEVNLSSPGRELWVRGGRLFVPTYRNVVCLQVTTGKELWSFAPGRAECLYVLPHGERLVVWDWWRTEVYCLSVTEGSVVWKKQGIVHPCVLGGRGDLIFLTHGEGQRLQAVELATGSLRWSLSEMDLKRVLPPTGDLGYFPFLAPVVGHTTAVAVGRSNRLRVVRMEDGAALEAWEVCGGVVGLARVPGGVAVAGSKSIELFRWTGQPFGSIPLEERLYYLKAVE